MKYLVQGNYRQFKVTLTQKSGELITPYVPTDADEVSIILRGARTYEYPDYEQSSNVLTFADNGCLKVGLYALEVKIVESTTHRLRCMYREQIRVVASNDDVPTNADFEQDDIELQAEFEVAASVIVVDDELSLTSTNPVQNKVVTKALGTKGDTISNEAASGGYMIYLKNGNTTLSYMGIPWVWNSDDGGFMPRAAYDKLEALPTNEALTTALNDKQATLTWDTVPTENSTNPVTSGGLYNVLGDIESILDNINGD